MIGAKLALIGVFGSVVGEFVSHAAGAIIFAAAVCGGLGYLIKHIVLPVVDMVRKAHASYELSAEIHSEIPDLVPIVKALPDWLHGFDRRLEGLERAGTEGSEPVRAVARELGVIHRTPAPPRPPRDQPPH